MIKNTLWALTLVLFTLPTTADVTATAVRVEATVDQGTVKQGAGFVVALTEARSLAYIVTAAHVIEGGEVQVFFALAPSEPHPAQVLFADHEADLALLKVDRPPLTHVASVSLGSVNPGVELQVVGYPSRSRLPRIASATASSVEGTQLVIQLPATEGNSGGP